MYKKVAVLIPIVAASKLGYWGEGVFNRLLSRSAPSTADAVTTDAGQVDDSVEPTEPTEEVRFERHRSFDDSLTDEQSSKIPKPEILCDDGYVKNSINKCEQCPIGQYTGDSNRDNQCLPAQKPDGRMETAANELLASRTNYLKQLVNETQATQDSAKAFERFSCDEDGITDDFTGTKAFSCSFNSKQQLPIDTERLQKAIAFTTATIEGVNAAVASSETKPEILADKLIGDLTGAQDTSDFFTLISMREAGQIKDFNVHKEGLKNLFTQRNQLLSIQMELSVQGSETVTIIKAQRDLLLKVAEKWFGAAWARNLIDTTASLKSTLGQTLVQKFNEQNYWERVTARLSTVWKMTKLGFFIAIAEAARAVVRIVVDSIKTLVTAGLAIIRSAVNSIKASVSSFGSWAVNMANKLWTRTVNVTDASEAGNITEALIQERNDTIVASESVAKSDWMTDFYNKTIAAKAHDWSAANFANTFIAQMPSTGATPQELWFAIEAAKLQIYGFLQSAAVEITYNRDDNEIVQTMNDIVNVILEAFNAEFTTPSPLQLCFILHKSQKKNNNNLLKFGDIFNEIGRVVDMAVAINEYLGNEVPAKVNQLRDMLKELANGAELTMDKVAPAVKSATALLRLNHELGNYYNPLGRVVIPMAVDSAEYTGEGVKASLQGVFDAVEALRKALKSDNNGLLKVIEKKRDETVYKEATRSKRAAVEAEERKKAEDAKVAVFTVLCLQRKIDGEDLTRDGCAEVLQRYESGESKAAAAAGGWGWGKKALAAAGVATTIGLGGALLAKTHPEWVPASIRNALTGKKPETKAPEVKKTRRWIGVLIAVLVIVAILVVGGVLMYRRYRSSSE